MLSPSGRAFMIRPGNGMYALPLNATGTSLTAQSNVGTTFDEVEDSLAEDSYILGISSGIGVSAATARDWTLAIGVGAAASEVVVATAGGTSIGSNLARGFVIWLAFPVFVAAGSRLSIRMRLNSGSHARNPREAKLLMVAASEVVPV